MNADIVTGVALCIFFVAVIGGWNDFVTFLEENFRRTLPRLEMGFGTLLLAHLSFDIPYVILNVLPKLRQMDSSLIDAAQDLGCTWMGAFWKVILDGSLLEGDCPGDQAGHRLRRPHRLHHEH